MALVDPSEYSYSPGYRRHLEPTVFFAKGKPGEPLYFVDRLEPLQLTSACEDLLQRPVRETSRFLDDYTLKTTMFGRISEMVNRLQWPLDSSANNDVNEVLLKPKEIYDPTSPAKPICDKDYW